MNYSTLQPYSYTTPLYDNTSYSEWKGQRSSKFPPTIRHTPKKDLIKTNFQMPDQTPTRGRGHFFEPTSFEKPFRSSIQKVAPIEHWHLRQSKIRTMNFEPTQHHPRRQMRHNIDVKHNPESVKPQSLRTFYFANSKTQREYSVQQRMQRKTRIDPVVLRNTFYKDLDIFKKN